MRWKCICLECPNICAFHGGSYQLSNVKGQKKSSVDGQLLTRSASRKEMLDGEARRCRTQNGHIKITLLDGKNALQVRLIRAFTSAYSLTSSNWQNEPDIEFILDCKRRQATWDLMVVVRRQLKNDVLLLSSTSWKTIRTAVARGLPHNHRLGDF